jgi:hypothetical protein
MRKPLKLVIDGPALARWLTSNPQHQNPADYVAVICHANGPLALLWSKISDDHKDDAHKKPKADPLYRALRDMLTRKRLPPPKPTTDC